MQAVVLNTYTTTNWSDQYLVPLLSERKNREKDVTRRRRLEAASPSPLILSSALPLKSRALSSLSGGSSASTVEVWSGWDPSHPGVLSARVLGSQSIPSSLLSDRDSVAAWKKIRCPSCGWLHDWLPVGDVSTPAKGTCLLSSTWTESKSRRHRIFHVDSEGSSEGKRRHHGSMKRNMAITSVTTSSILVEE